MNFHQDYSDAQYARAAAAGRRGLTEAEAARHTGSCLLCGGVVHGRRLAGEVVIWDLCDPCNGVFAATAARVAAAAPLVVTGPAAAALEAVAGQLELDEDEA